MEKRRQKNYFDYSLVFLIIFLLCLGFVMLYSITSYSSQIQNGSSTEVLFKQMRSTGLGLVGMVIVAMIPCEFYKRFAFFGYILSYILILLVLSPIGLEVNGAKRWLLIGGMSFQPAEFAKLATILFLAFIISKTSKQAHKFSYVVKMMALILPISALLMFVTSNLSSAIIVAAIGFVMIFVASPKYSHFVGIIVAGVAVMSAVLLVMGGYRLERIMVWLNPEEYAQEGGYRYFRGFMPLAREVYLEKVSDKAYRS